MKQARSNNVNAPDIIAKPQTTDRSATKQSPGIPRSRPQFLVPTVASIAVQMTSVLTLIMLLLLMISAQPGDGGNDSGGSGNEVPDRMVRANSR